MDEKQTIAYISDVGAQSLKPLFIAGSCVVTIFLDLSFISERWLRHRGRLAANTSKTEKYLATLSMIFAAIGTVGLICLSIFDTWRHPRLHDVFLLLFIAGYVISAVFICWEYQRLGIHFRQHRILRMSFWIKLSFIIIEVILAVAFASCNWKNYYNAAAVLEWAVSFIFTFYIFSFFIDLIPAVHSKHSNRKFGRGMNETEMQQEANDGASVRAENSHLAYNGRMTADSERTLGGNDERIVNGIRYKDGVPVTNHF